MNKIIKEFDIIIIGAGLSGLVLAYELSKRTSKKILLLEQKKNLKMIKTGAFGIFQKIILPLEQKIDGKKYLCLLMVKKKFFWKMELNIYILDP